MKKSIISIILPVLFLGMWVFCVTPAFAQDFVHADTFVEHRGLVRALAFSPDGQILASAGVDTLIHLWNPTTGTLLRSLRGHTKTVTSVAFSPDGRLLASSSVDGSIRLWNPQTGREVRRIPNAHPEGVQSVDFSADGGLLASGDESGNVVLWQRAEMSPEVSGIIPDPALRDAVEKALKKTPGATINESDMMALTSLEADWAGIEDLTGLEFATNLKNLSLANNLISDVSALRELKKLTTLQLSYNQLSDISAFSAFRQLTELRLDGNGISDVSALAALTKLQVLGLGRNQISDVSPLRQLKQLTWLYLSYNQISNVSALRGLTKLSALYLSYNQIANFSPLAGLVKKLNRYENGNQTLVGRNAPVSIPDPRLRAVIEKELGKSPGATITKANMQTLTRLNIENTENIDVILDLTGIEFAENLLVLKIDKYGISDISVLARLKKLTDLSLVSNNISDISPLSGLRNLTDLHLRSNNTSDISPLSELRNLTALYLISNKISDISVLAGLKDLKWLYLGGNKISDISPLSGLKKLTDLSLVSNNISDISPLSGLRNLTDLSLVSNNISDISPLSGLRNLRWLDLSHNRIVDFAPIAKVVENLDRYDKEPQLKSLIPDSVEILGPTTVTSVVRDYTFTARVTNANNQRLGGVEVEINGRETVRTNSNGDAKFDLNFSSVGAHNITASVRDEETGTEFQKHFPNRVEMLKPYSVELLEDLRTVAVGNSYTAIFVVKSADGQVLEGFQVTLNVGKWKFETIRTEGMIVPLFLRGEFPDFVSHYDPVGRVIAKKAFPYSRYSDVSPIPSDNGVRLVHANFELRGYRVSPVPSDGTNTDSTDSKGKARCSQRLLSKGEYGVSATVLLNGKALLTTSFSDKQAPNRIYFNPRYVLHGEPGPSYYQVPGGWRRDDSRSPIAPPAYRVKVVQPITVSCGTSAPSPEELANIKRLSPLFGLHLRKS